MTPGITQVQKVGTLCKRKKQIQKQNSIIYKQIVFYKVFTSSCRSLTFIQFCVSLSGEPRPSLLWSTEPFEDAPSIPN